MSNRHEDKPCDDLECNICREHSYSDPCDDIDCVECCQHEETECGVCNYCGEEVEMSYDREYEVNPDR